MNPATQPASQGGEEVLVDVIGALCLRRTRHRLHRSGESRGGGGGIPEQVELVRELRREAGSSIDRRAVVDTAAGEESSTLLLWWSSKNAIQASDL
ncbi:uncharacterized protein G2W53_000937 [Senna tora]|uniref:Uncharacterized protein n=1 Tax=Senna tora TaxID=362788 RepID=A0A834XF89_9FABA|nr:uncharacterized protein G2W53_000937 [Senna tora]